MVHYWQEATLAIGGLSLTKMPSYSVFTIRLVVLVKLREAQNACNIKDLFPQFDMEDIDNILAAIRNGNGNGMLLVLDGFDELPDNQRNNGSFFIELIKLSKLQKATIIITSRPSVSARLIQLCGHLIDRHLEILGFTEEKVEEYAKSVYSSHESQYRAGFLQFINNNLIVKGMMYLPLHAAIIASLFDKTDCQKDFQSLKTMTQLFDELTRSLKGTGQKCQSSILPLIACCDLRPSIKRAISSLLCNTPLPTNMADTMAYEVVIERHFSTNTNWSTSIEKITHYRNLLYNGFTFVHTSSQWKTALVSNYNTLK